MVDFTIKSIHINGFKNSNINATLTLAETQTSTVYGKNGCGKTTLLRILSAVFDKDEKILRENRINNIKLLCEDRNREYNLFIKSYEDNGLIKYDFSDLNSLDLSLLYITTDRGLNNYYRKKITPEDVFKILSSLGTDFSLNFDSSMKDIDLFVNKLNLMKEDNNVSELIRAKNILIDNITMAAVEELIIVYQKKVYNKIGEIQTELLNAILTSLTKIEVHDNERKINYEELYNLDNQCKKYENLIIQIINYKIPKKNNILKTLYEDFKRVVKKSKKDNYVPYSNIPVEISTNYIKLLINLIEANKSSLMAVDNIKNIMERYMIYNKILKISEEHVSIEIGKVEHDLNLLSNGERQFLTFLTVLSTIGKEKDIILIDEPGISLDTDWQEVFVEIMESLCPNSQIIYTTHSPDISMKDTNMICNLETISSEG